MRNCLLCSNCVVCVCVCAAQQKLLTRNIRKKNPTKIWQSTKPKNAENKRKFTSFISIMVAFVVYFSGFFSLLVRSFVRLKHIVSCLIVYCIFRSWLHFMFCFWLRTISNGNPGIRITKSFQLLFHIFCSYCSLSLSVSQHACARCSWRTRIKRVILAYPVLQTESPTTRTRSGVCCTFSFHPHARSSLHRSSP